MTKRNAESTRRAKELANQSRQAADAGAAMNTAMKAIKNASGEIAKIIKTIDEIPFQANILAQRSAKAARETADKIEGAISKKHARR